MADTTKLCILFSKHHSHCLFLLALMMAMSVCQLTTLVQTLISQHPLDWLPVELYIIYYRHSLYFWWSLHISSCDTSKAKFSLKEWQISTSANGLEQHFVLTLIVSSGLMPLVNIWLFHHLWFWVKCLHNCWMNSHEIRCTHLCSS